MWPVIYAILRSNAVYLTLPIAGVVGFIGYNIENLVSDKYTPFNKSIQEGRVERLTDDKTLSDATNVEKLKYKENVFGKNVSPSLENKK